MSSELQLDVRHLIRWRRHLVEAPSGERLRDKRQVWCLLQVNCVIYAWAL